MDPRLQGCIDFYFAVTDFPADPGLITDEFHVCEIAAERYPNNYYTWNHRTWCLNQFPNDSVKSLNIFVSEWMNSKKWVSAHVSDHSGFQYRQNILSKLISTGCKNICALKRTLVGFFQTIDNSLRSFLNQTNDSSNKTENLMNISINNLLPCGADCDINECVITPEYFILGIICSELLLNNDLILMYIGHEALWYHRRFLINTFQEKIIKANCRNLYETELFRQLWASRHSHKNDDGIPFEKDLKMEESVSESLKAQLLYFEQNLLTQCTSDCQQSKAASKHRVWMENVLKMKM